MFEPYKNTLILRSTFGQPQYFEVKKIEVFDEKIVVKVNNNDYVFEKNDIVYKNDKKILFRNKDSEELKLDYEILKNTTY